MKRAKQFHLYVDGEIKNRIDGLSAKKQIAIPMLVKTFLDLNDVHDFFDPDWVKKLVNSEWGEDIKKGLVKEIEKSVKGNLIGGISHNCSFLCPFIVEEKDISKIVCMRDWEKKSKILKIPIDVCEKCHKDGYVFKDNIQPLPLTDQERWERNQTEIRKRQHENYLASINTGGMTFDELNERAKKAEDNKWHKPFGDQ